MAVFGLTILDILLLLYAFVVALVILSSFVLVAGFPRLGRGTLEEPPLVSIVLPVRNQERTVESCVESLVASRYPRKEVIVVDGGSEDRTSEILKGFGDSITLLEEPPLPQGWVGKNWACHHGYRAAKGDFLLFTDGDTLHHPELLEEAVRHLIEEDLHLVTLSSRLRVGTFWERTIQPLMIFLIGLVHRGRWVNRPDKRFAVGNGQFLLFQREAYEDLGGHASVKARVDEDYRLAQRAKDGGYRMRLVDGRRGLEVRMYTSLREIWEGWSKNAFAGMDFSLYKILRSTVGLLLLLVLPYILLGWGLLGLATGHYGLLLPVSAVLCILIWARLGSAHSLLGGKAHYALLTPVGALAIAAVLLNSAYRYRRRGGVEWKGRLYGIPKE